MTDIPVNTTDKASATTSRPDSGGPQMREDVTNSPGLTSESASEPGQDASIRQVGGNSNPFSASGSLPGGVSWSSTPDDSGAGSLNDDGHNVQINFGDDHITGRKDQSHREPAHGGKGRADVTAGPTAVNRVRPTAKTSATATPNEVANSSKASSDSAAASTGDGRVGTDSSGQSDQSGGQTGSAAPRADHGSSGNDASESVNSTADPTAATQNADGITRVSLTTENKAQADANTPLSKQEAWDAAKKGAADWAKERAVGIAVDVTLGPVLAHVFSRPIKDALKGPEPPEPLTPREREAREHYDAMQRALDIATIAATVAADGIVGTASELRTARNAAKEVEAARAGTRGARSAAASSRATNTPHEPTTQPKPVATAPPPEAAAPPANPEAPVAPKPATPEAASPPKPIPGVAADRPPLLVQVEIKPVGGEAGGWRQLEQPTRSSYSAIGIVTEGGGYEGVATYDRVTGKVELKVSQIGDGSASAKTYQIGQFTPDELADLQAKSGGNSSKLGNLVEGPIRKMISDATGQAVLDPGKKASKTGVDWRPQQPPLPYVNPQPASERAAAHKAAAAKPTGDPARPRIGLRAEDHFDRMNAGTAQGPRIDITAPDAASAPESSQPERKTLRR